MKTYNVLAIDPSTNRPCTFRFVPADQVNVEQMTFAYNAYYPALPILKLETVTLPTVSAVTCGGQFGCE